MEMQIPALPSQTKSNQASACVWRKGRGKKDELASIATLLTVRFCALLIQQLFDSEGEDIENFLLRFEHVARTWAWRESEWACRLIPLLTGKALEAYSAMEERIGKNVICDRTATPLDAFRMMSAAQYYPKLLSIMGNVLRFLPAFVRMKELVEEGYVGELLVCEAQVHSGSLLGKKYNWSCDDLMGGGGLHSVGSYIIDLLGFLTGRRAARVHGFLKTFVTQTEHIRGIRQITSDDFCTFQMALEGGACCTVTLNFNVPGEFRQEVMVVGTVGRLTVSGTDLYGQKNGSEAVGGGPELLLKDTTPLEKASLPEKAFSDIPSPFLTGTIRMIQAVRRAFQDQDERRAWDGRPLTMAATFEDCLYALCVVDAVKKSSACGEWQNIAVMKEEPEVSPAYLISEAMRRSRMSLYC
ncbi:Glucose-fructose oxidoreductase domain-containing protein 1 [Merluccius polli]|uniref:Glucose-fructose oxidoreductase domain-containing protein 1 n=1 Tax=Merluccius polli TaxID=89951 RepID=A0AA47M709_MERPO|nr:Glucose-fructose oxidoreductase domain-containing protein 1 [Merluccius polli]